MDFFQYLLQFSCWFLLAGDSIHVVLTVNLQITRNQFERAANRSDRTDQANKRLQTTKFYTNGSLVRITLVICRVT